MSPRVRYSRGLVSLRSDNLRMGVRIANMARLLFGRRSEKLSKDELQQLMLAFGASEEEAAQDNPDIPSAPADDALADDGDEAPDDENPEEEPPKKPKHPGRTRLSDKLKREVVETAVPQDERACSQCGLEMGGIGFHAVHSLAAGASLRPGPLSSVETFLARASSRGTAGLRAFADLYAVERKARDLSPEERLALRKKDSLPVLAKLEAWLAKHEAAFRPSETIEEARRYASQQLGFFKLCFTDGRFEIDNGDVERGMRRIAIGRRNWLFAGASTGAPRLAVAYTLVESCRRLGIPTNEYLRDVMTKVHAGWSMRRIGELTPDVWGIERGLLPSP